MKTRHAPPPRGNPATSGFLVRRSQHGLPAESCGNPTPSRQNLQVLDPVPITSFTPLEIADWRGVTPRTVRNWITGGRKNRPGIYELPTYLKATKLGPRLWSINESDLIDFLGASHVPDLATLRQIAARRRVPKARVDNAARPLSATTETEPYAPADPIAYA